MKENLLHFIWKLKLYSKDKLKTTNGEKIEVLKPGIENFNSGPDFLNTKIRINEQLWVGNVEIHSNASDWYAHNHETDTTYDSVILHVVWEHNIDVYRSTNETIATLELKNFISNELLTKYGQLFNAPKKWINCENEIASIDSFTLNHWFEKLYFERLIEKSKQIEQILSKTKNNWEETLFMVLAKNFGLKVNAEAFLAFANSFDFTIVRKISYNLDELEALFFGQAAMLLETEESIYFKRLKSNYKYLQKKFNLQPISKNQFQFFRLRPTNFPTIRLSQLANLYHKHQNLFSKIIETTSLKDFHDVFNVSTSSFWSSHFTFKTTSNKSIKKLSKPFIELLLINTIIPIKFLYLKSLNKTETNSILELVEQLKPEKNAIIASFNKLKIKSKSAFETQALLQLKNKYCNNQRCLQCAIGNQLLKN